MPPPRLQLLPSTSNALSRWSLATTTPSTTVRHVSTAVQRQSRRKHQDPYALAQARARKAANISRQATLQAERSKSMGDPIRGVTTSFLESFDTGVSKDYGESRILNHFVRPKALEKSLSYSRALSTPVEKAASTFHDQQKFSDAVQKHAQESDAAEEALKRITAIENASSAARRHANIQRCIDTFGRHHTDNTLRPRPNLPEDHRDARAGPDTGSSEVQAAILTARIRALANHLETRGKKDKVNKRNLRLLVHRRQKLLRYMRKRERGGDRWKHLVDTLGLTEGTWRGEISL